MPLFDQAEAPAATRREAAERIAPFVHDQRGAVLDHVRAQGRRGAIDEEIRETLEICESSCRARRIELAQAGELVDSGRRRATRSGRRAIVWTTPEYAGPSKPPAAGDRPSTRSAPRTSTSDRPAVDQPATRSAPAEPAAEARTIDARGDEACARCGGRDFRDTEIHRGRSVRRDCAKCKAFVRFTVWHGATVTAQPGGVMARRAAGEERGDLV
ncbi:MAG TPA: hypothetical protein VMY37_20665 [Thermoguttaceae bacterium]|nr:hypothetical protein [Thermoguttaceae bacterium]